MAEFQIYEKAAVQFQALGDVHRLQLLAVLMDGPRCVGALAEHFDVSMATISQRLKVLYHADLVTKSKEGRHVYYSLSDSHVHHLIEIGIAHAGEHE